ncbi:hypothetical protein ACF0H5_004782 [Mactra antiquata]
MKIKLPKAKQVATAMEMYKFRNVLLAVAMVVQMVHGQTDMAVDAQFTCDKNGENSFKMHLRVYDANGMAVSFHAIDTSNQTISTCQTFGTSIFEVSSNVFITAGTESNPCGLRIMAINGVLVYTWMFKLSPYEETAAVRTKGTIMKVECPANDLTNGRVETVATIGVPQFVIRPALPEQATGENSVAPNANLIYEINISPNSLLPGQSDLLDAKGIYAESCFLSSSPTMSNSVLLIGADGCSVGDNGYSPTNNFVAVSNTGNVFTIRAQYATAVPVSGGQTAYVWCTLGKCLIENDPSCENRCNAVRTSAPTTARNTGVTVSASVTVQDREAQSLEVRDSQGQVVDTLRIGDIYYLYSYYAPSGSGIDNTLQDFRNAKGFFNYNCECAFNPNFIGAVQFIDNSGCPVENDVLAFTSTAFSYDSTLSSTSSNLYVLRTGAIVATSSRSGRLWLRCSTQVCLTINHNFCSRRCQATNNNVGAVRNLGYIEHITDVLLLIVSVPAIDIQIKDNNGDDVGGDNNVNIGDPIAISFVITPTGQGDEANAFEDAEGIYVYSCYMIDLDDESQIFPFIDENGCSIEDSPFVPTQNCIPRSDNPPFEVDCGIVNVPLVGIYRLFCNLGMCFTRNNPACQNRCAAGPYAGLTGVSQPPGLQSSTPQFQSTLPGDDDPDRTAIKTEELNDIITAISVVGAVVLLTAVGVVTYLIVRAQRKKAQKKEDDRSYNY